MKYIRLFENETTYQKSLVGGGVNPMISLTTDNNEVHFLSHNTVDLGLPSKTLWADRNIGAHMETDYGLYFQWGATQGYSGDEAISHSSWATCPGNGGNASCNTASLTSWDNDNLDAYTLKSNVDAATVNWGSEWKMPLKSHFEELINYTSYEKTIINNVEGYKFTNKSDSSKYIFLPLSGNFISQTDGIHEGYYWSSHINSQGLPNLVHSLWLRNNRLSASITGYTNRFYCQPIRPIFITSANN